MVLALLLITVGAQGTSGAEPLEPVFDAYEAKDYAEAAALAFEEKALPNEPGGWARLYLGASLVELRLRLLGTRVLAALAKERAFPALMPQALTALHRLSAGPQDLGLVDSVFLAVDAADAPDEVRAHAQLLRGLEDLRRGHPRWARAELAALPQGTAAAYRARYVLGMSPLVGVKAPPAATMDMLYALAAEDAAPLEVRNDAWLGLARLRYEARDFEGSLDAYQHVRWAPLDPGQATLYAEQAWALYQLGRIDEAFGLSVALDAPAFRDELLPDKYLMQAMVLRDKCHYALAARAARRLLVRYAPSLAALRERRDLKEDPLLRRAALAHRALKQEAALVGALDREARRLHELASTLGEPLTRWLTRELAVSRAEAERRREVLLGPAVDEEAQRLLEAAEDARRLEYDASAKLNARHGMAPAADVLPPADGMLRAAFDGEYWGDELRSFRLALPSRCSEASP